MSLETHINLYKRFSFFLTYAHHVTISLLTTEIQTPVIWNSHPFGLLVFPPYFYMQAHRLIYKEFYFSFCPFVTKERNVIFDGGSDFVIFSWGVEEEGGLVFDCSCCFGVGLGYLFLCVLGGGGGRSCRYESEGSWLSRMSTFYGSY